MKHLIHFSLFEEVNPKDISFIQTMDDYFTVSFEFEIETDDKSNIHIDFDLLEDDDLIDDIMDDIKRELKIRKKSEKNLMEDIIQSIVDANYEGNAYETIHVIFNPSNYKTDREKEIVKMVKSSLMLNIAGDDLKYKIKQAKKYFPNFNKKWGKGLDFVEDATLERGIEIKPKKYLSSLSNGIEMINDFYEDLDKQDYWKFTERTGLHVNIGVSNSKAQWNPIKGLMMLNDFNNGEETPFVFKDMTSRLNNQFCGSLIPSIKNMPNLSELKNTIDLHNIKAAESIINKFLTEKIKEWGYKNFGFNITKLEYNYVEFRYVGGDVSRDVLIEKLKYFAFVVYAMTNSEYKKREYLKKLYKFVDNL